MPITVSGAQITFPDATTQTTAGRPGTVTSVATGNGLSGGTITTSGTLSIACPSFNTVGSYTIGWWFYDSSGGGSLVLASGDTVAAGGGNNQLQATSLSPAQSGNDQQNVLSGTWRNMGVRLTIYQLSNPFYFGAAVSSLFCRVS